jgi:hypothetical protein
VVEFFTNTPWGICAVGVASTVVVPASSARRFTANVDIAEPAKFCVQ